MKNRVTPKQEDARAPVDAEPRGSGEVRQLLKRRRRQALTVILTPLLPVIGARARRRAERIVNPKGNFYISPVRGVSGFFRALQKAGARHVVLRWFEELPRVGRGHDLDVLVADEALPEIRALLSTWPLGQKVDYYSASGRNGAGYRPELLEDVPAFPPAVAAQLLNSARTMPGGWSVPAPREHFLGLAYHAVYLKGYASGLPPDAGIPARKVGSRDYADVLTELAATVGVALEQPVTMASLDRMLRAEGWAPPPDHLDALAPANRWLGDSR